MNVSFDYSVTYVLTVLFTQDKDMAKRVAAAREAARILAESTEALQGRLSGMLERLRKAEVEGPGAEQEDGEQLHPGPFLCPQSLGTSDQKT